MQHEVTTSEGSCKFWNRYVHDEADIHTDDQGYTRMFLSGMAF